MSDPAGLSTRRKRILEQILPEVVPSAYGDAKFTRLDKNWKPGAGYTTCGALPTFVAERIGMAPHIAREGLGRYGLSSMRDGGILRGAWRHHNMVLRSLGAAMGLEPARPRPGDFYLLCSGDGHDTGCCTIYPSDPKKEWQYKGAKVEHVGVIVDASGGIWTTADAGQPGPNNGQAALYVKRNFDATTGFMTGEANRAGKPMRRLCGWLDVDAFPFAD